MFFTKKTDVDKGVMGSYAIIGAHLTIANGTALASKYNKTNEVSVCFFGDGTTNIGAFHEALNMAKIWNLPIVFVCENNLYMEYTPIHEVTAVEHPAADRASAYDLDRIIVDGNDADEMLRIAEKAISKAREGKGPSLIEAKTYRHSGHSRADPGKYRPDEEVKDWMENKDPIKNYRAKRNKEKSSKQVASILKNSTINLFCENTESQWKELAKMKKLNEAIVDVLDFIN